MLNYVIVFCGTQDLPTRSLVGIPTRLLRSVQTLNERFINQTSTVCRLSNLHSQLAIYSRTRGFVSLLLPIYYFDLGHGEDTIPISVNFVANLRGADSRYLYSL